MRFTSPFYFPAAIVGIEMRDHLLTLLPFFTSCCQVALSFRQVYSLPSTLPKLLFLYLALLYLCPDHYHSSSIILMVSLHIYWSTVNWSRRSRRSHAIIQFLDFSRCVKDTPDLCSFLIFASWTQLTGCFITDHFKSTCLLGKLEIWQLPCPTQQKRLMLSH